MPRIRPSTALLTGLTVAFLVQLWSGLSGAPDVMATHFGADGVADGWMTRGMHAAFSVGMWALMVGCFWLLPAVLHRVPDQMISLPNRDYWLAPERRAETFEAIRTRSEAYGALTLMLMLFVYGMVFDVNQAADPVLPEAAFFAAMGVYLVVFLGLGVETVLRFRKPQAA